MATQRRKFKAEAIRSIKIAIHPADMTDGGGTSGTYLANNVKLPAGCVVLGTKLNAPVAWSGDVSAVAIVGTAADDDMFYETPESVFAAVSNKYGTPATYPTDLFQAAEVAIQITVTTGTDFTILFNADTARLEVEVYYIDLNAKSK